FCTFAGYERVSFTAVDKSGHPIYHTNVMMAVGDSFAVVALDALVYPEERAMLLAHLEHSGKAVVEISLEQMQSFAGNMLALRDKEGRPLLVMSATALRSLTDGQKAQLAAHATLLAFEIPTIETFGGGSVRCMLAEIFLPRRS
ncbi:MAG: arginine deiminase-related protein, partial [Haliscomenobacter sp.]